ncbi:ubiquinol oxidase subunit II [Rhizobiales bacterium Sp-1]|uniref:Ubiquinol oxidase subunit 2 n=1 Tax=Segnochrobactrum spirostomi TaxID=2608987 RepID=A0A6A7YA10_9HYPH|nr:ubiquinol oxidase subunit II [Segnochrobactrum spirostomi]
MPLASCNQLVLLDPKGAIGEQEKDLILIASGLMLLVVIPVMVLTLVFAWRYRAGNTTARYSPTWSHSTKIEIVVWTIPILIVATLAVLIWRTTHALDPYRPLASEVPPINVEVVALDWKWLFIYPDYGIATVNSLTVPVGAPINFRLTSASMMNSFFIPQLGSQIYAMAGMQTKLHLIADAPGTYAGRSSAFSGPGFSDMRFDTVAVPRAEFETWVQSARTAFATKVLDDATYRALARPSVKAPPTLYGRVEPGLFDGIADAFMAGRMSTLAFNEALCTVDGPLSRRLN